MDIFIDSADVDEIAALVETGLVDGVTTNPSLIAKSGRDIKQTMREICSLTPGSVSAEVTAVDFTGMMNESKTLLEIADNITIKVPLTFDGLRTCKALSDEGHLVNVTLCFSANQALLAAKAGAAYISPFIGRLDDISMNGLELIKDIRIIYNNYPHFETQILAASVRHPIHVLEVAKTGADVVTIPPSLFRQLYKHPLTDQGLQIFLDDWKKTGQSII